MKAPMKINKKKIDFVLDVMVMYQQCFNVCWCTILLHVYTTCSTASECLGQYKPYGNSTAYYPTAFGLRTKKSMGILFT